MLSWLKMLLQSLLRRHLEKSSLELRFFRNALWALLSSIISRFLTLLSLLLIARILGQDEYGALGMIRSTTMTFASFAGLGLGLTSTKFVSEFNNNHPEKVEKIIGLTYTIALLSGLLFLIVFFALADTVASGMMNRAELVNELRIGSFILFFATVIGVQTGIASGLESFKTIAFSNLAGGLISFPIMILLSYSFGTMGAVFGLCINQLLIWASLHLLLKKALKEKKIQIFLSVKKIPQDFTLLWQFTMPAFLATLMPVVVLWLANTWLIKTPDGYKELAVIDVANQWKEIIMYLPAILSTSILPILSSISAKESPDSHNKVMRLYYWVMLVISLTLILPVALFAKKILVLYGFLPSETDAWVLMLYCVSTIFLMISSGLGQLLISKSKMWQGLLLNFAWGVINLGLTYYFLSRNLGSLGLALAFFISYAVYTIGMYIYSTMNAKANPAV
jgi:O-antigen/teichoic acid export membrane protein